MEMLYMSPFGSIRVGKENMTIGSSVQVSPHEGR